MPIEEVCIAELPLLQLPEMKIMSEAAAKKLNVKRSLEPRKCGALHMCLPFRLGAFEK